MVNSVNDGLNKPDQLSDGAVVATEIGSYSVLTVGLSGGVVTTAKLGNDAVTGAKMAYGQLVTGSPSAYAGAIVQYGAQSSTAGSKLTVNFGTAFKATPVVFLAETGSGTPYTYAGSVTTAQFIAQTVGGSEPISWMAYGSGTF